MVAHGTVMSVNAGSLVVAVPPSQVITYPLAPGSAVQVSEALTCVTAVTVASAASAGETAAGQAAASASTMAAAAICRWT